jgi:hypothetical protein
VRRAVVGCVRAAVGEDAGVCEALDFVVQVAGVGAGFAGEVGDAGFPFRL